MLINERDGTHLQAVGGDAFVWREISPNATDDVYVVSSVTTPLNSDFLDVGATLYETTNDVFVVDRTNPDAGYLYTVGAVNYYTEGGKRWYSRPLATDPTLSFSANGGGATGTFTLRPQTVTNNVKAVLLKESALDVLDEYSKTNHTHRRDACWRMERDRDARLGEFAGFHPDPERLIF